MGHVRFLHVLTLAPSPEKHAVAGVVVVNPISEYLSLFVVLHAQAHNPPIVNPVSCMIQLVALQYLELDRKRAIFIRHHPSTHDQYVAPFGNGSHGQFLQSVEIQFAVPVASRAFRPVVPYILDVSDLFQVADRCGLDTFADGVAGNDFDSTFGPSVVAHQVPRPVPQRNQRPRNFAVGTGRAGHPERLAPAAFIGGLIRASLGPTPFYVQPKDFHFFGK